MHREKRSGLRLLTLLLLALALTLSACGKTAEPIPVSTPAPEATTAPTPAVTPAPEPTPTPIPESTPAPEPAPYGSPWVDSLVAGNVPAQTPGPEDDLYLYCNSEAIAAYAGQYYLQANANPAAVKDYAFDRLDGGAPADPGGAYTDGELAQLRVFYTMAQDLEALSAAGLTELEPWLTQIDAAQTLDELNAVLVSEDFPFSLYLRFTVSAWDMSAGNNVFVWPHFLFVDDFGGAEFLQESDDPITQQANLSQIGMTSPYVLADLLWLGVPEEDAVETLQLLYHFEQAYGADGPYNEPHLARPFGDLAASNINLTLDEMAALCPRFPVRETAEKFGKSGSPCFTVQDPGWLESFNSLWNEENLDVLKLMTMEKLVRECAPVLDPAVYAAVMDADTPDAADFAAELCDRSDTFGLLLGKIYVADRYSDADAARLTELTDALIDGFRRLLSETDWLGDASREKMLEKLEKMRCCVLFPDGGYPDFDGLELTPAEEGGTLLGNYLKLRAWHEARQNARIGESAQALYIWDTTTPSYPGCFYDYDTNSINILPGFTASQGYGPETSQEELLGVYGWIIAHEISHSVDFAGAQFDADGTANGVLVGADLDAYLAIVDRLAAYYDTVEALPGTYVVGDRVKTEAAADLIGMQLALEAAKGFPDFDYEAFFRGAAKYMFMSLPDEAYVEYFLSDEHPLQYLRVNINAQMYPELYETFGVREGDGMYLPETERIRFWGR